jgi:hypothetical protein
MGIRPVLDPSPLDIPHQSIQNLPVPTLRRSLRIVLNPSMPFDRLEYNQSSVVCLGATRKRRSDGLQVNDTIAHALLLLESRTCVVLLRVLDEEAAMC